MPGPLSLPRWGVVEVEWLVGEGGGVFLLLPGQDYFNFSYPAYRARGRSRKSGVPTQRGRLLRRLSYSQPRLLTKVTGF